MQIENKLMEICSTSSVIKVTQIILIRYYYTPTRMIKI